MSAAGHTAREGPGIAVVAGMPRSGTTMLHHVFDGHPEIFVPFRKETSYFTFQHDRGIDWYRRLFSKMSADQLGMDISGNYILIEESAQRLLDYDRTIRVIVSVRDPAAIVVSLYRLMYNWDRTTPPFEEFVHRYRYRLGPYRTTFEFADGLLTRNLEIYRQAFGDNLLMIDFRLYRENLLRAVAAIEKFVGVRPYFSPGNLQNQRINSSGRRSWRIVSRLLSTDAASSMIYKYYPETSPLFPDSLARRVRKGIDRLRVQPPQVATEPVMTAEQLDLARRTFATESRSAQALFEGGPLVLGSGQPFRE